MNPELIIRAWKEPEFRARLTSEQFQALPEHPSGKPMTELGDDDLSDVTGGKVPIYTVTTVTSVGTVTTATFTSAATTTTTTLTTFTFSTVIIENMPGPSGAPPQPR